LDHSIAGQGLERCSPVNHELSKISSKDTNDLLFLKLSDVKIKQ